jgi:hypothetical protein
MEHHGRKFNTLLGRLGGRTEQLMLPKWHVAC